MRAYLIVIGWIILCLSAPFVAQTDLANSLGLSDVGKRSDVLSVTGLSMAISVATVTELGFIDPDD